MTPEKERSTYDFRKLIFKFTDEPYWFRLTIIIIALAGIVAIIWALHQWAIPTFIANKLTGIKWSELLKFGKGRSP
jgi:hypothetical protein